MSNIILADALRRCTFWSCRCHQANLAALAYLRLLRDEVVEGVYVSRIEADDSSADFEGDTVNVALLDETGVPDIGIEAAVPDVVEEFRAFTGADGDAAPFAVVDEEVAPVVIEVDGDTSVVTGDFDTSAGIENVAAVSVALDVVAGSPTTKDDANASVVVVETDVPTVDDSATELSEALEGVGTLVVMNGDADISTVADVVEPLADSD
ncbi:hypothetical protein BGZ72_002453 [Mortierella alpina]|nr:hypothetical protein BGZ72_002453 [Mortierella alpina]